MSTEYNSAIEQPQHLPVLPPEGEVPLAARAPEQSAVEYSSTVTNSPNAPAINSIHFEQAGNGPSFQAYEQRIQNIYRGDHVVSRLVPETTLGFADDDRLVEPRDRQSWFNMQETLNAAGVAVLVGPRGSGRRTAAIQMLRALPVSQGVNNVFDLEPEWERPRIDCLPDISARRFILDMSEPSEKDPEAAFGQRLADYGKIGRERDRYLVVVTTPDLWEGRWTQGSDSFTFMYESPDAKELVRRELVARGCASRQTYLDDPAFSEIWRSHPKPDDAVRLADLISRSPEGDFGAVLDEYSEWRVHIDTLLAAGTSGAASSTSTTLSKRAVLWSAALLDGGTTRSIIAAADALLNHVGVDRTPADVLGGLLSSERLKSVDVVTQHGRAMVDPSRHGLREAVLNRMWDEFSTQHDVLQTWAIAVAADPNISDEEATRVVDALTELAIRRRNGQILSAVRDGLLEKRRTLVVDSLTSSALDSKFGSYVRNRMYQWAVKSPSPAIVDLIAELCAGEFGRRMPEMALVRLGHAANHGTFGSQSMVRAFEMLTTTKPAEVVIAIQKWSEEERLSRAAKVAFLALAATPTGRTLLLGENCSRLREQTHRRWLVRMWQLVLADAQSIPDAECRLRDWGDAVADVDRDQMVRLFADVFTPRTYRASLTSLFPHTPEMERSLWSEVLGVAITESRRIGPHEEW